MQHQCFKSSEIQSDVHLQNPLLPHPINPQCEGLFLFKIKYMIIILNLFVDFNLVFDVMNFYDQDLISL